MKDNNVLENEAIYMCAKNKDVDEINKRYFEQNNNLPIVFKKKIQYRYGRYKIDKFPKLKKKVNDIINCGNYSVLKKDMKVMITENIGVSNGICNGTFGYIIDFDQDNDIVEIKTNKNNNIKIKSFRINHYNLHLDYSENWYSIING